MNVFLDWFYENGSPVHWEEAGPGTVDLQLIPDHARFSPNRQLTHWNVRIHVPQTAVGQSLHVRFRQVMNCWNGRPSPAMRHDGLTSVISVDGKTWRPLPMQPSSDDTIARELSVPIEAPCVQLAHLVPYSDNDLQRSLDSLRVTGHARTTMMGATVEGRPLEMVEIGNPDSQNHVLIRARAHPWESGGSWVLEGLMRFMVRPEAAELRKRICFCLMPMANKDGVVRGMTRFNVRGVDLNRGWLADTPHDPALCPENASLQAWLVERQRQGRLPRMACCLHNDNNGRIHASNPPGDRAGRHRARLAVFERMLRDMTWFTEGMTPSSFHNPGTFGEGLTQMFGIDAFIYELRACWADGLGRTPMPADWMALGRDLAFVFDAALRRIDAQESP